MRNSEAALFNTVREIYSTVDNLSHWETALAAVCNVLDCPVGTIDVFSLAPQSVQFSSIYGMDPRVDETYLKYFSSNDPKVSRALAGASGGVYRDRELLTRHEMNYSSAYQELWLPSDLGNQLHSFSLFDHTVGTVVSFMRGNHQGPFSDEAKKICATLQPHFDQALRTFLELQSAKALQSASSSALNTLGVGIAFVDFSGQVLHMNNVAEELCRREKCLSYSRAGLRASHPEDDKALQRAIGNAISVARCEPITGPEGVVGVRRELEKHSLSVMVSPLTDKGRLFNYKNPAALVVIIDPDRELFVDEETLIRTYGLTPAEANVAARLCSGYDTEAIAQQRGKSLKTVQNQLKSILNKTGKHSQSELVVQLLKSVIPL